jgi:hypothetical protein
MEQQPQPRNSSAATFASMLAQNIVVLLDELDQLKAEVARLRAAQQPTDAQSVSDKRAAPMRVNGGAAA